MKLSTDTLPVATAIVGVAFLIVAAVGGVICIVHPTTLSFSAYATLLVAFAGSAGLLGVGRGIAVAGNAKAAAQARLLSEAATTTHGNVGTPIPSGGSGPRGVI